MGRCSRPARSGDRDQTAHSQLWQAGLRPNEAIRDYDDGLPLTRAGTFMCTNTSKARAAYGNL